MNNSRQNTNSHSNIQVPNYQILETLYTGSRTLVYRAIRANDQLPVVIKFLKNEYPTFSELVQFRNQYTIAKNLHQAEIIQTYSLEPYRHGYALIMEDFGGISLKEWALKGANTLSLKDFLEIALSLCHAFDILYRERIIHKDIKPTNILINPATKQVKLIDFSIASLLPRETQTLINPNVLEGTLAYISPEQTGRMNRGIDYRTDFYGLGVSFYELLTGELPFQSNDPMELVHSHIAKTAPLVHEINPQIPSVISEIVMKLMAKNAEDRYQSALGLKYDLENCLTQLQVSGEIQIFKIAQRDICDRFLIPDKLYGRETEVETLLQAFERVSQGATEMMLIAGFSGIGKTAVVNEVHKPIVRQRGYFIKGKFDQFQRNIPFSAFVQAFRDLMGQFLSESDAQLQTWKIKILEAVGDNGQVLIEVIPELENIIGKQPTVIELSASATQNRFNLLFQNLVQVFTRQEHPLVMFLDDLQWADSASLNLLQLLMQDTGHLLVLGAYRDNEVSSAHTFILTVDEIVKAGATVQTITLPPLREIDMNLLVADTLNCELSIAEPLTKLVYQKTQGNPFFATQFIKVLNGNKLISFDWNIQHWQCDIAQVRALAITNDVVEFMALQLQKLPAETQNVLKLAACIGAQFDLNTLAIVSEQLLEATAADLWKALQEGLIIPNTEVYKFFIQYYSASVPNAVANPTYFFLHDRVQQAAYSLVPDDQKTATHLKIGQLLQTNSSEIEREEKLFDIVGHLNLGIELITQPSDAADGSAKRLRVKLAQLNLAAGAKARSSTAYGAAVIYLQTGIELLEVDCWQSQYDLTLNLHTGAAEASYLNGDFEGMEQLAALVLHEAQTIFDKVKIYEIQIIALTTHSQMLKAIAVAREALAQLGVELPTEVEEAKIGAALQDLNHQLQGRHIEELVNLPLMSDRTSVAAMQLLGVLFHTIYQGNPGLLPFLSTTMVRLSLQFGNTPASMVGYASHGMVLCGFFGELKTGYGFGEVAFKLLDQFNVPELKSSILLLFGVFIQPRQDAYLAIQRTLKAGYKAGMETGNFLNAGYCISTYGFTRVFAGEELDTCEAEAASYSAMMVQAKQESPQVYLDMTRQMVQNLRQPMNQPDCLFGTAYDERVMFPKHQQDNDLAPIGTAYFYKILLAYTFGNYTAALDYIAQLKQYWVVLSGFIGTPIFHFYIALTYLAVFPNQSETKQAEIFAQVETEQTTLYEWAHNTPINYLHKWYLVEAEKYRVLGKNYEAGDWYDRAIYLAKENQFLNEEALANELAAKFYLYWGKDKIAAGYMQEAYYCYARWGAKAKIEDLEKHYSQLLQPILQQQRINLKHDETINFRGTYSSTNTNTAGSSSISDALDFTSVLKAAIAISSSLELDQLVANLTRIILENSGAKKSALILPHDNAWQVRAITFIKHNEIQTSLNLQSLNICQDIPVKIINYVKNTKQTVVIDNCQTDIPGVIGEYMHRIQPQSVLCTPIINQGHLMAILYLENKLTSGVFTRDRLSVINLLSSQAAISLENARLYQQAGIALQDLQQAQLQIVQSEKMSALGNLVAGVAHEMNNPLGFISASLQQAKPTFGDIIEHLKLYQEILPNKSEEILDHAADIDLEYSLEDLPKMIDSMIIACNRLKSISTSLRTFSRGDRDYKVPFNIHEGINSTILILKHRLKANQQHPAIEVATNYGNLPQVECFPGQLNQVFMNLLANAIDALEESNQGRSSEEIKANSNCITITTSVENDLVKIAIADNGQGMDEQVKSKIFDHLFTTKAVGKGTGLGLAIARQIIVEKHGGSIQVNSILGQGTEFIISLPTQA